MIVLPLLCLIATLYQLLSIRACFAHITRTEPWAVRRPGVSVLKPLRGADEGLYEALCTHARMPYPDFEILLGVGDPADPALAIVDRLRAEFPQVSIRTVLSAIDAPNSKVGVLEALAAEAVHPVLVVNDSDISVPHDYLFRLVTALENPQVGLVTCLYRATYESFPAMLEALGISTDFAPSAIVAQALGVKEFGLGSTLAFRAETLHRIGGFAAFRDFIADDYQLGKRIHQLGLEVEISRMLVSTHLTGSWSEVWSHQVRWARTIRVSQSGYFGLPLTNASFWALLALLAGYWWAALPALAIRILAGTVAGRLVLRDGLTKRIWWLIPTRDLMGMAVWIAGAVGSNVGWRGSRLTLGSDGRIVAKG